MSELMARAILDAGTAQGILRPAGPVTDTNPILTPCRGPESQVTGGNKRTAAPLTLIVDTRRNPDHPDDRDYNIVELREGEMARAQAWASRL